MTLIELVRSIDGAEEALAWEGLECNRRWETGWKWSRRPISEGMARTVIHGLAGNLRADRACPVQAAFDPTQRSVRITEWGALIPASVPQDDAYTAACLALIAAAGKEKK